MDSKDCRRILVIGAPNSGALEVVNGSTPPLNENGSTAGLLHEWNVETEYYSANVPIWLDEIADVEDWRTEFMKPEAKEVIDAVGAWIYCFRKSGSGKVEDHVEQVLKAVQDVSEEHAGYGTDVVMLAVRLPTGKGVVSSDDSKQGDWEDLCLAYGFEYVDYAAQGTNEFKEKTGFARLKEALEANEWALPATDIDNDGLDLDALDGTADDGLDGFTRDEAEMTAELFGMKAALNGSDYEPDSDIIQAHDAQESQVENLDRLMGKLLAVKEQSQDMPEAQRKRMAAQAIRELMKDESM